MREINKMLGFSEPIIIIRGASGKSLPAAGRLNRVRRLCRKAKRVGIT